VPGLYPRIRPQADYGQSVELLARAKRHAISGRGGQGEPGAGGTGRAMLVKGGLMLGLGEDMPDVRRVVRDLAEAGCDIVTVGQYMRPTLGHPEVVRYVPPAEFDDLAAFGRSIGVPHMFCGPLVRSSYNAAKFV
jgi:lipoic acid synthetase